MRFSQIICTYVTIHYGTRDLPEDVETAAAADVCPETLAET